jgi:hypothetical protein
MEKSEHRFVIKFFFVKGFGAKVIQRELTAVLASTADSLSQVREWRARFAIGDVSSQDEFRAARHHSIGSLRPLQPGG